MGSFALPIVGKISSLGILFSLLPGLLTYLVIRALTSREKKLESVEAVLHGLAYTLLVHAVWSVLTLYSWIPTPDILGLSLTALVLGVTISRINNAGLLYELLQRLDVTNESAWQSTWETSFRYAKRDIGEFSVLHLKDSRRILGAVRGFSGEQANGHVAIDTAQWVADDGDLVVAPGLLLFDASEISFVQFLPTEQGKVDE